MTDPAPLADTTCEHGRPDHQVLIRQLAEALGLDLPALAETPASVWRRLLASVEQARGERDEAHAALLEMVDKPRGLWSDVVPNAIHRARGDAERIDGCGLFWAGKPHDPHGICPGRPDSPETSGVEQ